MDPRSKPIHSEHKEGTSNKVNEDGSIHQSKWYDTYASDNSEGSSVRSSSDIHSDGNVTGEHVTVQK